MEGRKEDRRRECRGGEEGEERVCRWQKGRRKGSRKREEKEWKENRRQVDGGGEEEETRETCTGERKGEERR